MPNTLGSEYKNLSLVFENLLITSFSLQNIGLFIVNREITNIISNKPQIFLIIAKWSTAQNLFFVYDNNEIHTNIFNEYTNTFTSENVLPEKKISPKIIKQNGTKNITMSFKKLT